MIDWKAVRDKGGSEKVESGKLKKEKLGGRGGNYE
jgi:hypothetical protein